MAQPFTLPTHSSDAGHLTVFENIVPGSIQRIFYIYGTGDAPRAGHRHKQAWNALICVCGQCDVFIHDGQTEQTVTLDAPNKGVLLAPEDWHVMHTFSPGTVLLVVSNMGYDKNDYIYEPYPGTTFSNT